MEMRDLINIVEAPNKYYNVIEKNKTPWKQTIYIENPLTVYHATHRGVNLVLTDREATSYNSMGTWLTSNKEMAQQTYGPDVASYALPTGSYILARRGQDLHGMILNCLPMIERHIDPEVAEHLLHHGFDEKNLKWLKEVRAKARAIAAERGESVPYGSALDEIVHGMFAYKDIASWRRWKKLQATGNMYTKVARSGAYAAEFKKFMVGTGCKGFIWNGRHWDGSPERQTIFLVLEHEPLHPIEQFSGDHDNADVGFLRGIKSVDDSQ